ncbi:MAG: hypothetical protein HZB33_13995 [Nitrospirae bacterium]|nr:hypothetical protein [Nitrospirota bacterium]
MLTEQMITAKFIRRDVPYPHIFIISSIGRIFINDDQIEEWAEAAECFYASSKNRWSDCHGVTLWIIPLRVLSFGLGCRRIMKLPSHGELSKRPWKQSGPISLQHKTFISPYFTKKQGKRPCSDSAAKENQMMALD